MQDIEVEFNALMTLELGDFVVGTTLRPPFVPGKDLVFNLKGLVDLEPFWKFWHLHSGLNLGPSSP